MSALSSWFHVSTCASVSKTTGKAAAMHPQVRQTIDDHGGRASAVTLQAAADRAGIGGHLAAPTRALPCATRRQAKPAALPTRCARWRTAWLRQCALFLCGIGGRVP